MAKVAVEQAILDLERCQVDTPFDAWVTQKAVETGQHLAAGQSVGSLYRAGAFDIEVKIPMGDLVWFPDDVGSGEGLPVEVLFMETSTPRLWNGRLARVKAALDQTTRTLPVVVEVDEPAPEDSTTHAADRLKPGMFVTVRIQGRQVENVHRLPRHLIHDGDTVYLAADNQLSVRPVTILRRFKQSVLISDGLSDGDLVVTSPLSGAVPGMKIRIEGLRD
jgi:RND family efflux transporter MFP subunit